ncbi:MAG TPA: DNA polymerase III subunit delta' [Candidatus Margulisiibacteriota bacterium]|nr:DNA polymerase III subunit delta' [Candidatus Margulisiibacteriota bacterium]
MLLQDIKGQDSAINILKHYMAQERLMGGYLFSGSEGVGKKLAALALAKAVNCTVDQYNGCDNCPSCRKIDGNQHPDVHLIDCSDSDIKIENVRQLQKEINLKAYEAKKKIFIVDNAHNFTAEAGNAILKALEEPPQDTLIILISDKPTRLFKTIISRCRVVKFFPLKRQRLEAILKSDYQLDDLSAHFLAYFSEGRLGRALKLKDGGIIDERNNIIDKFIIRRTLNLQTLSLSKKDELRAFLNIISTWFRDIYLVKAGASQTDLINVDRKEELLKAAESLSFVSLNGIFESISDSLSFLEANINTKLLLHNLGAEIWQR